MSLRTPLFASHPRTYRDFLYVYPVISRRSGGLSIGLNLNPDQACNFDCVYCSVDRTVAPRILEVALPRLADELELLLSLFTSGELFTAPPFDATPAPLRRLNDVALSGDGEPTLCPDFAAACALAAAALDRRGLTEVKLLLLTNGTLLERPEVEAGLQILDRRAGELWVKLDAGTPAYYRRVDRARLPFPRLLEQIRGAGRRRPLVIQALFARLAGEAPPGAEIDAWIERLVELRDGGCAIRRLQVYTVARPTAERFVTPLDDRSLDAIAAAAGARGFVVETHYGPGEGVSDSGNSACR